MKQHNIKHLQNTALLFLLVAPVTMVYYSVYVFNPANAGNILLYILQVCADIIALLNVGTLWLTILLDIIQSDTHKPVIRDIQWMKKRKLSVDILVPVANEPLDIIEHTISKVVAMDYPHKTYMLDDGTTMDAKAIAQKYEIEYVRRPAHAKQFAKSGNINFGLARCKGEFVGVFDADHAPEKTFLTELLPFFENDNVALVQTPQHYINTHNFIAAGTAQAQEIFYKYVQPAKNSYNASFCVGTNMLYRRSALDTIGGIAQRDHSEDIWTSLLLHEKGYASVFYNKVLAKGRAPETIPSFFRQQNRWARGGFSLFFTHNPLFLKTLTIDQKFQYFFSNIHYFTGFSILIYLMIPIIYLFTGAHPMNLLHSQTWIMHYAPYFLMVYFLPLFLLGTLKLATISTSLASFSPYLKAFFSVVLKNKYQWIATEAKAPKPIVLMDEIWPHVLFVFLSLAAVVVGWYNVTDLPTTLYTTFWTLLNSYLLFLFIRYGLDKKKSKKL